MKQPPFERYAIFAAPRPDTALAAFARGWIGYDSETGTALPPVVPQRLTAAAHRAMVAAPARYGFHGTLKAPFRLADGVGRQALFDAVETLAGESAPVTVPALSLATFGGFVALVPAAARETLDRLARACVIDLDPLRAPLTAAEVERREPASLTVRQRHLLRERGYPWVLEEFRFHLTLTGPLDRAGLALAYPILEAATAGLRTQPLRIEDLCLVADPGGGAPFRLLRRFALA